MIADFINSALVIDDNLDEVKGLSSMLESKGVAVTCYTPDQLPSHLVLRNRKIIFIDLHIGEKAQRIEGHISKIRGILKDHIGLNFGLYGIVLWTKHLDEERIFEEKIQKDRENNLYTPPLFIVGLDKIKYLKQGKHDCLYEDLDRALNQDRSARFFIKWDHSVMDAQANTITNIYSLIPNYVNRSNDFLYILKQLALNYTGISEDAVNYPLYIDAFKSFDDILHAELINCEKADPDLFNTTQLNEPCTKSLINIYARINSCLLIDENNITAGSVVPGNVYEVIERSSPYISDKAPSGAQNIVMEITPPCDFSNKNKRLRARLIGGFLVNVDNTDKFKTNSKKRKGGLVKAQVDQLNCSNQCYYSEVFPIIVGHDKCPKILVLDFRCFGAEDDSNMTNEKKYKILFRAKPKLFADILQKFSSHAARLGVSVIHC